MVGSISIADAGFPVFYSEFLVDQLNERRRKHLYYEQFPSDSLSTTELLQQDAIEIIALAQEHASRQVALKQDLRDALEGGDVNCIVEAAKKLVGLTQ